MGGDRTVGIGMDYSPTSKAAVRWVVDNLADAGDWIILIHVQSGKSGSAQKQLWEETGSSLIPPEEFTEINLSKIYGISPDSEVLEILATASKTKQVKVLAKIYWGDPREKLCNAVEELKLNSLTVGSRGFGPIKRECEQLCHFECYMPSYSGEGTPCSQSLIIMKNKCNVVIMRRSKCMLCIFGILLCI